MKGYDFRGLFSRNFESPIDIPLDIDWDQMKLQRFDELLREKEGKYSYDMKEDCMLKFPFF